MSDRQPDPPVREPLLTVRATLILLAGVVGATISGGLSVLAGARWAQAVLTGAAAFAGVVVFLNSTVG
jgi:hypothetical protein